MAESSEARLQFDGDGAEEEKITERLVAYNLTHAPVWREAQVEARALRTFAYAPGGELIGGLIGRTHAIPFWFEISVLWVDEEWRGAGLGRRLVTEAEREAAARGCRFARLSTSQYQAPGFYERLEYAVYGHLADCPPGEMVTYFWKRLDGTAQAGS